MLACPAHRALPHQPHVRVYPYVSLQNIDIFRYNTIPQIQKACAFSTFVGREITCFILFYCFRYLSGNFQRALNAVDQVAEQPNDHAALAP